MGRADRAWAEIAATLSAMTPAIYDLDLEATCEALAPAGRGGFSRLWAALTSPAVPGSAGGAAHRGSRANASWATGTCTQLPQPLRAERGGGAASAAGDIPCAPRALPDCQASYEHLLEPARASCKPGQDSPAWPSRPVGDCERFAGACSTRTGQPWASSLSCTGSALARGRRAG